MRIGGQFAPLTAVVIGVKNEANFAELLQQHNPARRPAVFSGGGQRHGVRFF